MHTLPKTKNILICCLSVLLLAPSGKAESFANWLCRVLGLSGTTYANVGQVRDGAPTLTGNKLVAYDLQSHVSKTLWTATGLHSPTLLPTKGIVVLRTSPNEKDNGIWYVPLSAGKPRLIASGRFEETLGVMKQDGSVLVVGYKSAGPATASAFQLRLVSADGARLIDPPPEFPSIEPGDLRRLRGSQVLNERLVQCWTNEKGEPGESLAIRPSNGKVEKISPSDEGIRFHPAWLDEHTITYIEK